MQQEHIIAAAYRYALLLLAKRDYSRYALSRKIIQHHQLSDDDLVNILDKLEQENYLSDLRYAQSYIRNCYHRGRGPLYIAHKLREKGVSISVVEDALATCELHWDALAQKVSNKKFGQYATLTTQERAKQWQFLYGRGFK